MSETSISPLFAAVNTADLSTLAELLEKGLDVNDTNNFGETPIFLARTKDVAELLVQHGANLEHRNQMGWTVLENAAFQDNMDLVEFYLQNGASLDTRNNHGSTPLKTAILRNRLGMVELFLKHGADANGKDVQSEPLLACATSREMFELLVRHGADPKARDDRGNTILGLDPNTTLADLVIEAGVDVNDANDQLETPLMFASHRNDIELMRLLIEHGADIEARDTDGKNALWYAAEEEALAFLLEQGANPNAVDNQGLTPIMECDPDWVGLLVKHGADIEAREANGYTALMLTDDFDGPVKMRALLEHGARADARDNEGTPAFIFCITCALENDSDEWFMEKALEALLETKVQPDITDAHGRTLLMFLVEKCQSVLAVMLLERGADPLLQDNNGESAFSRACKSRDKNMLRTMATHSPAITEAVLDELAATGQFHNSTLKKLRKLVAGRG